MSARLLLVAGLLLCLATPALAGTNKGMYVGVRGGMTLVNDGDFDGANLSYDPGGSIGGMLGYDFGPVRTEFEVNYRTNDVDSIDVLGVSWQAGGSVSTTAYMANIYVDFPQPGTRMSPYFGAGIGVADLKVDSLSGRNGNLTLFIDGQPSYTASDTVLAGQFMFGTGIQLAKNLTMEVDYRFLFTDKPNFAYDEFEYGVHTINVGLRLNF